MATSSSDDATRSSSSGVVTGVAEGGTVMKKGPWTAAEDAILIDYVNKNGEGNWNAVQRNSGLQRCGKSCRLRWANHLRPNLKKGAFTADEERLILELHAKYGNKWARMASQMPGRTDNEIKNYWNTRLKRHQRAGLAIYPSDIQSEEVHLETHRPPPRLPRQRKQHNHHQAKVLDFQNQRTIGFNPTTSHPQPFLFTSTHQTPIITHSHCHQFNFFAKQNSTADHQEITARPLFDPIPSHLNSMKQKPDSSGGIEASEFGFVHLLSSGISASGMLDDVLNANARPLKKMKSAAIGGGDEENSSSGMTSIGMRVDQEPVVEINPLDDELTSLLDSFPSASPTPQWYRRVTTNVNNINDSLSDARGGGVVLDLTTTTTTQPPSSTAEAGSNGSSSMLWHQSLPTIY